MELNLWWGCKEAVKYLFVTAGGFLGQQSKQLQEKTVKNVCVCGSLYRSWPESFKQVVKKCRAVCVVTDNILLVPCLGQLSLAVQDFG